MSVALLVKFKDANRETAYYPVATESAFPQWGSRAQALGLPIVASFAGFGAIVPPDELPALIAEFRALRNAFASSPETSWFAERADFLIASLEAVDPEAVEEIWGG